MSMAAASARVAWFRFGVAFMGCCVVQGCANQQMQAQQQLASARQACNAQYPLKAGTLLQHAQCVNTAIDQFALPLGWESRQRCSRGLRANRLKPHNGCKKHSTGKNAPHDQPLAADGVDSPTYSRATRREEARATIPDSASVAYRQVGVLPVRDRLNRDIPNQPIQHAERQVVDRYVHSSGFERSDPLSEVFSVVEWVNPKRVLIGEGKTRIF